MRTMGPAWKASAAYLYLLRLQPAALAWEYLRRNPDYRRDWQLAQDSLIRTDGAPAHWGLRFFRRSAFRRADCTACLA
jgi:hypothetical protein